MANEVFMDCKDLFLISGTDIDSDEALSTTIFPLLAFDIKLGLRLN